MNINHSAGTSHINWAKLKNLAAHFSKAGIEPGTVPDHEWKIIEQTLDNFVEMQDWSSILQLRRIFNDLYDRDSMTGLPSLQRLDQYAIEAAGNSGDKHELGHLWGARGHNLHRQGYHKKSIEAFDESAKNYLEVNEESLALKSYYMTSLCHRALGDRKKAREVLADVLDKTLSTDLWRANPLQVLAWLAQDDGNLVQAEELFRQVIKLYKEAPNSDMLIAGVLADLGEVVGILGRIQEARELFEESLAIFDNHQGQYNRQEARTLLKYSELLMHQKDYRSVFRLLNRADDKVSGYGHYYDLLWQIEIAKAFVFLRSRDVKSCLAKMRSVFRIRRLLGLSNTLLIQHLIKRYTQRLLH